MTWTASADDDNAPATRVTFYKDVLPILQNNCQVCHRPSGADLGGMVAPMSLLTYEEARPWAKSIARQIDERQMPPWHATDQFHGVFANERTLKNEERATILEWVKQGAIAGNKADAPAPVAWSSTEWAIGEPDLILEMPGPFTVADDVEDLYVNFTVDTGLTEDRWVRAMQFKPGSTVVHHIIGYVYNQGEVDFNNERGMIGGIAPGNDASAFADGYGFRLNAGSKFVFAMHYHKEKGPGTAAPDRSKVGLRFYPAGVAPKQVHIEAIGNMGFEVPPFHPEWTVGMAKTYDRDIKIHFLMPHMHLRGAYAKYTAFYPDGRVEELLEVPRYDFNWQTSYEYREPKLIPAGTRLEVLMKFNNTAERGSDNGFNPSRAVRFGGPTTDEMALGWLSYSYEGEEPAAEDVASATE